MFLRLALVFFEQNILDFDRLIFWPKSLEKRVRILDIVAIVLISVLAKRITSSTKNRCEMGAIFRDSYRSLTASEIKRERYSMKMIKK